MNKFYINIGDWSEDGHGQCERFLFESNYSVEELQEAYRKSCEKTGVRLEEVAYVYADASIKPAVAMALLNHGCPDELLLADDCTGDDDQDIHYGLDPTRMAKLIVWFVGLSMPKDFQCDLTTNDVKNFNGFHGDLNVSFGYGLFDAF